MNRSLVRLLVFEHGDGQRLYVRLGGAPAACENFHGWFPLLFRALLHLGAGLALRPRDLWTDEAWWDDLQAASLVTKPIPSTGEHLPVVGIGTARRFDVGRWRTEAKLAPLREVVRNFTRMGGKLIDTAPSYGNDEEIIAASLAAK